jgi:hypothetical protein
MLVDSELIKGVLLQLPHTGARVCDGCVCVWWCDGGGDGRGTMHMHMHMHTCTCTPAFGGRGTCTHVAHSSGGLHHHPRGGGKGREKGGTMHTFQEQLLDSMPLYACLGACLLQVLASLSSLIVLLCWGSRQCIVCPCRSLLLCCLLQVLASFQEQLLALNSDKEQRGLIKTLLAESGAGAGGGGGVGGGVEGLGGLWCYQQLCFSWTLPSSSSRGCQSLCGSKRCWLRAVAMKSRNHFRSQSCQRQGLNPEQWTSCPSLVHLYVESSNMKRKACITEPGAPVPVCVCGCLWLSVAVCVYG